MAIGITTFVPFMTSCSNDSENHHSPTQTISLFPKSNPISEILLGEKAKTTSLKIQEATSPAGEDFSIYLCIEETPLTTTHAENTSTLKGAITTTNTLSEVSLFAYTFPSSNTWKSVKGNVLTMPGRTGEDGFNAKVSKNTQTRWISELPWPNKGEKLVAMSYSPYASTTNGISISGSASSATIPTISFSIPEKIENQPDLLVATSAETTITSAQEAIALTYQHTLTPVRFKINDANTGTFSIKKITFKNVPYKGTLPLDQTAWSNTDYPWTIDTNSKKDFSVTPNTTNVSGGSYITDDEQTFMMLPQTSLAGIELYLEYSIQGSSDIKTANLKLPSSMSWKRGTLYTISLSPYDKSSVTFNWTTKLANDKHYSHEGGTSSFSIISSRTINGQTTAVPYIVEYSTDNGNTWTRNAPAGWFTNNSLKDNQGHTQEQAFAFTLSQAPYVAGAQNITKTLRKTPEVGSESKPYILGTSTQKGGSYDQAANTYIISAPGWYAIPPYYGPIGGTYGMKEYRNRWEYKNFAGLGITNPNITTDVKNSRADVKEARIGNQDVENLVTNVSRATIDNIPNYIKFYVSPNTIREGNAMLSLIDNQDRAIWSWHIWVKYDNVKDISFDNNTKKVLNKPIGYCHADTIREYQARSIKVRFTQQGRNDRQAQRVHTITQDGIVEAIVPNNMLYQWGRPTANFPIIQGGPKPLYNGWGITYKPNESVLYSRCIQNPNWFYLTGQTLWMTLGERNDIHNVHELWMDNQKTIYDPSPYGYRVMSQAYATALNAVAKNDPNNKQIILNGTKIGYTGFFGAAAPMNWSVTHNLYLWSAKSTTSVNNQATSIFFGEDTGTSGKIDQTLSKGNMFSVLPQKM